MSAQTAWRSIASGAHKAVKADAALPQALALSSGEHLVDADDHVAQRACRARKTDAIVKHPRRVERVRDNLALVQRSWLGGRHAFGTRIHACCHRVSVHVQCKPHSTRLRHR